MKILKHSNEAEKKELFCLIGEYFASALVKKELGESMISDERFTWFIAMDDDTIQGLAGTHIAGQNGYFDYWYVLPEYRSKKIGTSLLDAGLKYLESQVSKIESVIVEKQVPAFSKRGFENVGNRGRYIKMRKSL